MRRSDVMKLQEITNLFGSNLVTDGLLGPNTRKAVNALSMTQLSWLKAFPGFSNVGFVDSIVKSAAVRGRGPRKVGVNTKANTITVSEVEAFSAVLAQQLGWPILETAIPFVIEHETPLVDGVYPTDLINSLGYRGIAQVSRNGNYWNEARPFLKKFSIEIGPQSMNWKDPYKSMQAVAGYMLRYIPALQRDIEGIIIDETIIYLVHNQGREGARRFLTGESRAQVDTQSREVRRLVEPYFGSLSGNIA